MAKRKRFSEQLRAAVDASGRSRYRISKQLGVTEGAMSRFMAGGGLSFDTLDRLAELLDLHVTTGAKAKGVVRRGKRGK